MRAAPGQGCREVAGGGQEGAARPPRNGPRRALWRAPLQPAALAPPSPGRSTVPASRRWPPALWARPRARPPCPTAAPGVPCCAALRRAAPIAPCNGSAAILPCGQAPDQCSRKPLSAARGSQGPGWQAPWLGTSQNCAASNQVDEGGAPCPGVFGGAPPEGLERERIINRDAPLLPTDAANGRGGRSAPRRGGAGWSERRAASGRRLPDADLISPASARLPGASVFAGAARAPGPQPLR